jgi:DNA helicase-2/ATP-dependent DNA helicase PcrA
MEDLIDSSRLAILKPYGNKYHYVIDIIAAIRELKREAITPADFTRSLAKTKAEYDAIPERYYTSGRYAGRLKGKYAAREKELSKLAELLLLYRGYERALREKRLYDYEDMIMETLGVLAANKELLLRLQERYQYILADEHQDANSAQNLLLGLLASFHANPNLFVVGDEKQAIFRFQGASLINFLSFTKNYPEALVVRLSQNYRSRQFILDAAGSLIRHNKLPDESLRVDLHAAAPAKGAKAKNGAEAVKVFAFSEPAAEHWFVAREIRGQIARGVEAENIAVLYRDNRDRVPYSQALDALSVPYVVLSDESILDDPEIGKFVLLLRAIDAPQKADMVGRALFIDFLKIDPYDAFVVFDALSRSRRESRERKAAKSPKLNDILRSRATLAEAGVDDPAAIMNRYKEILSWSAFAKNRGLMETLETVARESGFFSHCLSLANGHEVIRKFDRLIAEFSRAVVGHREYTLRDALRHIDTLAFYGVPLKARSIEGEQAGGVRLMTAHKSKGLEYDHVYIVGATDGHWGNRRRPRTFGQVSLLGEQTSEVSEENSDIADERRLFYVALTRARESVTISYASCDERGGRVLSSQFNEEIDQAYLSHVPTERVESELESIMNTVRSGVVSESNMATNRVDKSGMFANGDDVPPQRRKQLLEMFESRGLSVSALNNYLRCPWRYFFENLIRLPHAPNRHQLYGIAIHSALKTLFDELRFGRRPAKRRVLEAFERSLKRQPLSSHDFDDSLSKGKEALSGYFDTYKGSLRRPIDTEFAIRGVWLEAGEELGLTPGTAKSRERTNEFSGNNNYSQGRICLTGILDKLEKDNEADDLSSGIPVIVTDYKTGKPRSRNYIEGKTKDSGGDYKRQLVFYKLLLDNFADGKFRMTQGEIDFAEPDQGGRYRRERFIITDDESNSLATTIREVISEIRAFSYWTRRCEDKECEYCKLRDMMKPL